METILCLAHLEEDGSLARPALEAVSAARSLQEALPGSSLAVSAVEVSQPRYAADAAAAEAAVRAAGATVVIAPATSRWSRCLAGVAQRMNGRVDTHVTGISIVQGGKIAVSRWYYRQRMEAVQTRAERPWFILVDPGCYQACTGGVAFSVVKVPAAASARTAFLEYRAPKADEQTIRPDAELLLVAGAGWTKKQPDGKTHVEEAGALILDFLRKTQSSLGSSKSLVDLGTEGQAVLPFLSHLNQVGQTGSTPRHPKGLATCCHGEEPHVVGWRFINERRAVNLDPNCGWARGKADVLYVADAFEVMARVNTLLAE
ncbi:MAG: electron transfer flavoprotein subunit alpha [Bryobacteraceae bacterium]